MSWMLKLYQTYEACVAMPEAFSEPLAPYMHVSHAVHVEITIDELGNFLCASVVPRSDAQTLIPCTEDSAGRTGMSPVPHPLSDKLMYVAGDYSVFGGQVTSGYAKEPRRPHRDYLKLLSSWADSAQSHIKVRAVRDYVAKGRVVQDLVNASVLPANEDGKLLILLAGKGPDGRVVPNPVRKEGPPIFRVLANEAQPEDAVVRWRVECSGQPDTSTWTDAGLHRSWMEFVGSLGEEDQTIEGLCMVTGKVQRLANNHPGRIRHGGDKSKLISANDTKGFTYKGRFVNKFQACTVGLEVTQKAHEALRWLIRRQGHRYGDQTIVAWHLGGKPMPNPLDGTDEMFAAVQAFGLEMPLESEAAAVDLGDVGQALSRRFRGAMRGYNTRIGRTDEAVVLALYATVPGRMAISYYRELAASELLGHIENWHLESAWWQFPRREHQFVGVPSVAEIADVIAAEVGEGAGREKFKVSIIDRLLPCIIEGQQIPRDLVERAFRRACQRSSGGNRDQWEKSLGVACSLIRGALSSTQRRAKMALEEDRTSRDYLFGRLLALAEHVERRAHSMNNESRETAAGRYMMRFSIKPASTWMTIYKSLTPYFNRLNNRSPGFVHLMRQRIDRVMVCFQPEDFVSDKALGPEFLLGYSCQREDLMLDEAEAKKARTKTHAAEVSNDAVQAVAA